MQIPPSAFFVLLSSTGAGGSTACLVFEAPHPLASRIVKHSITTAAVSSVALFLSTALPPLRQGCEDRAQASEEGLERTHTT